MQFTDAFPYECKMCILLKTWPALAWLVQNALLLVTLQTVFPQSKSSDDEGQLWMLFVWVGIYLFAMVVSIFQVSELEKLKLNGKTKGLLRWSTVLTTLQLNTRSVDDFPTGNVLGIMATGVDEAIGSTFLNVFNLWENLFTTFAMTVYIGVIAVMGGYAYVLGFPIIMIILDYFIIQQYAGPQADKYLTYIKAESQWKDSVVSLCDMRSLITTYRQSKAMALDFKDIHQRSNKGYFETASFQNGCTRLAKQIHAVLAMCAYLVCGWLVCEHHMKVGAFVTIMMTIWKFDAQVLHLFGTIFNMSNGYAAIIQMSKLLNADTRRKVSSIKCQQHTV